MKNSTPKQFIFTPATEEQASYCRGEFLKEARNSLYSIDALQNVDYAIDGISQGQHSIVNTNVLLEEVIADVFRRELPCMSVAENFGMKNAMGFDIFDASSDGMRYAEIKDYGVALGSGSIKANVTVKNKFCTIIAVVVDPNIEENYAIYAIPPQAIANDTSENIDIPHHNGRYMDEAKSVVLATQRDELGGGSFAQYRVSSVQELLTKVDTMQNINLKLLAAALRYMDPTKEGGVNGSEKVQHEILDKLFVNCVRSGVKGWAQSTNKILLKPSVDWNDPMYDIPGKGLDHDVASRIFFNGNGFDLVNWPLKDAPKAKAKPRARRKKVESIAETTKDAE